jgi:hypothetical protein
MLHNKTYPTRHTDKDKDRITECLSIHPKKVLRLLFKYNEEKPTRRLKKYGATTRDCNTLLLLLFPLFSSKTNKQKAKDPNSESTTHGIYLLYGKQAI